MSADEHKNSPWPDFATSSGDGRRQRSDRSRRQIVEAMFKLMRAGNMRPTAAEVAETAGVGLRSVFRHFEDMESIFEEMISQLRDIIAPKVDEPFQSQTWPDKLMELVDRIAEIYESVFPMQVALVVRRFESEFANLHYHRELHLLRASLDSFLPKEILSNQNLRAAIEVNTTFATWRRLREDQQLSVADAKETLKMLLHRLTSDYLD